MKKLKFNSTFNHKQSDYKTRKIIVEKVITLYGKGFSELKDHPLRDDPHIAQNRDLMYIDDNDLHIVCLWLTTTVEMVFWWNPKAAATLESPNSYQMQEH